MIGKLDVESVCTAFYSILINGKPRGFINPSCGIKHDNPLSLYLFFVCAEKLTSLLRKAIENNKFKASYLVRMVFHITHLLFAK